MNIEAALMEARACVPGCFAAGYISVPTGTLVLGGAEDQQKRAALEEAAAAAPGLFDSARAALVARAFGRPQDPTTAAVPSSEAIFLTSTTLCLFRRSQRDQELALLFLCERSANLGIAITRARIVMPAVEAALS